MTNIQHIALSISLSFGFGQCYANHLKIELPNHHQFHCELAQTPAQLEQGLMYRSTLATNSGMVFVLPYPHAWAFWMKNTRISLDILWLNSDKKVIYMIEAAKPCQIDCPVYQPKPEVKAAYVLELVGGQANREQLQLGSQLKFLGTTN